MLIAMLVTPENLPVITALNDEVEPAQECVDNPTYYLYPTDPDEHAELIDADTFEATYTTKSAHELNTYVVEKK